MSLSALSGVYALTALSALTATTTITARVRARRRYALPRWAIRQAHLAKNAPYDFAWRYETVDQPGWGSAGSSPD